MIREGWTVAAHMKFKIAGVQQVQTTLLAGVGQRVFQQCQQRIGLQGPTKQIRDMAQEPTRWRQL